MSDHWKRSHSVGLLAVLLATVAAGVLIPTSNRAWGWLGILALLAVFALIAGHGITGLWRGALVGDGNRMSLSRFQLMLWTLIVLSAYLTAVLGNLRDGYSDALAVAIPEELWILLGISTTSLVASPLLKGSKLQSSHNSRQLEQTKQLLHTQGYEIDQVRPLGMLVANSEPKHSQWSELFKGEETGNAALLDIAKIQMFYFTLVAALAYGAALWASMRSVAMPFVSFPSINASIVALIGISHAGYLTNKVVPHSESK